MAREAGDLRREVADSESEVPGDERAGDDESAFGMAKRMQKRKFRGGPNTRAVGQKSVCQSVALNPILTERVVGVDCASLITQRM